MTTFQAIVIGFLGGFLTMFFSYEFMVKKAFNIGKKYGKHEALSEHLNK